MTTTTRRHQALLYALVGAAVCAVLAVGLLYDVKARVLFGDPNGIAEAPAYVGLISQLGVMAWASGGALCLLAWWLRWERFLLDMGLLTVLLAVDDSLQVHDKVLVDVEELALAVLGVIVLVVLWRHREALRATVARPWFASAAALLAASVLIDVPKLQLPGSGVAEELLKALGIAGWTAACAVLARERLAAPPEVTSGA